MHMNRIIYNSILVFSALLFASAIFCQDATSNRGLVLPASTNSDPTGNTYAILIGITDYNYLQPLKYADNDALLLRELLKSRVGGHVPDSNIYLLLNEHATNGRMLETIDRVRGKSKKGDKVIIYLGGHGAAHKSNYFFLSANCQPAGSSNHYKTAGAIRMDDIKENIESWTEAAVRVVLIVDACRTVLPGGTDGVNKVNILDEKAGDLMLLSASPNQVSIEDGSLGGGHGLFTYFLAKGMCGAAEGNNDGIIQFYELEEYVKKQVRERSKMVQIPSFCCSEQAVVPMSTVDTVFEQLIKRISVLDDVNRGALSYNGLKAAQGFADTTGMKSFHQLLKAIEAFNFEGENGAESILTSMEQKCPTCPVVLEAKRELAVAYLDFGQLLINRYLTGQDSRLFTKSLIDANKMHRVAVSSLRYELKTVEKKLYRTQGLEENKRIRTRKRELERLNQYLSRRMNFWSEPESRLKYQQEQCYQKASSWIQLSFNRLQQDSMLKSFYAPQAQLLELYGEQIPGSYSKDKFEILEKIAIQDSSAAVLNLLGKIYTQNGQLEAAEYVLRKAIGCANQWAYSHNNLGELLDLQNRLWEAEVQYRYAIACNRGFVYAYNNLAINLTKQERLDEAIKVCLDAISYDSSYVMSYLNLGGLYLLQGKTGPALSCFMTGYRLAPTQYFPAHLLMLQYIENNKFSEATELLNASSSNSSKFDIMQYYKSEEVLKPLSFTDVQTIPDMPGLFEPTLGPTNLPKVEMVYIEEGTYTMGCTQEQIDCEKDETPHEVKLDGFYIGKYEVTQGLWKEVMGALPSVLHNCMECPIYEVSWEDVQQFIQKLNKMTGQKYRLPTEAEWEYAARGGRQGVMFGDGSNIADPDKINFDASKDFNKPYSLVGSFRGKTVPVGSLNAPNAFGIHDMSGNVSEWCSDWYGAYPTEASSNPKGPKNGAFRVIRGGSWSYFAPNCRVATRSNGVASKRYYDTGFRLAKSK